MFQHHFQTLAVTKQKAESRSRLEDYASCVLRCAKLCVCGREFMPFLCVNERGHRAPCERTLKFHLVCVLFLFSFGLVFLSLSAGKFHHFYLLQII